MSSGVTLKTGVIWRSEYMTVQFDITTSATTAEVNINISIITLQKMTEKERLAFIEKFNEVLDILG